MISITAFFFIGGAAATLIRIELATPAGDLVTDETYSKLFTVHGVIMVWFFLIPSIPATLGNFLMPLMIGAREVAFPRLNLAELVHLRARRHRSPCVTLIAGGVDTGWTFYTPYSTMFSNTNVVLAVAGVFIVGFSSILTGINFIVTVHRLRAPGMTWFRLPLFVWAQLRHQHHSRAGDAGARHDARCCWCSSASSASACSIRRSAAIRCCSSTCSGSTRIRRCTSWCCRPWAWSARSSPASRARASSATARWPTPSSRIAALGFLVWGHHMFVSGQSMYAGVIFSLLSYLVAIPSAIKVFNWIATLYRGSIVFPAPMLYALGFIGLFTIGGLTGLFLAATAVDVHLTDTYFVVAHFHYIMVGGSVMAYFGGLHFWWPKITGRMYPEGWGRAAAILIFFGFNLTFFPQYLLGVEGMPRRYHSYPEEFHVLNVLSSAGASLLAIGYLLPLGYLLLVAVARQARAR